MCDMDKVLFELDNIMYNHGCGVRASPVFDQEKDRIVDGRIYTTANDVEWQVRPSETYGDGWWEVKLYSPTDTFYARDTNHFDASSRMTMKSVAIILEEMRQMAEDCAFASGGLRRRSK